jgi:NAD(P)-dependent dehydrogenase (short-subunit alcohol dehydrogenase family)
MNQFENKVAVVTGAASGIGRALAEKCAALGMKLMLADTRTSALGQVESELAHSGVEVLAMRTDVSKAEEVDALAERAFGAYGALHLLSNNAGITLPNVIWEYSLADWRRVLEVNLWGIIHGVHSFLPRMLAHGEESHIVNTSSAAGLTSRSGWGVYNVS